jgi:predicted phosphoadenosine phosphosulfate sulfurtransferase
VYPIYDWNTEDIWTFHGKTGAAHNPLYDRMHQAGMTIHQMRICEPFGDTQKHSLWLYQVVEPAMWAKLVYRVAGANSGALYANESGNVMGNRQISLPTGHTWESYANFLLRTMPPKTAEHYRNKIAVYLNWWRSRGYPEGVPQEAERTLETYGKVPSWRKICKTLLGNDYWCRWLGFSPTKTSAYAKYMDLMKRRRKQWQIFA